MTLAGSARVACEASVFRSFSISLPLRRPVVSSLSPRTRWWLDLLALDDGRFDQQGHVAADELVAHRVVQCVAQMAWQ